MAHRVENMTADKRRRSAPASLIGRVRYVMRMLRHEGPAAVIRKTRNRILRRRNGAREGLYEAWTHRADLQPAPRIPTDERPPTITVLVHGSGDAAASADMKQEPSMRVVVQRPDPEAGRRADPLLDVPDDGAILWLDAGDRLGDRAVPVIQSALAQEPDADLFYFDEDILEGGRRTNPWFKPDWSPELQLSTNLLGACVARRRLLDRLPPAAASDPASLAFHLAENAAKIVHIPNILLHRAPDNATWRGEADTSRCDAGAAHLERIGLRHVTAEPSGRVRWQHPRAKASIIIPTKDKPALLRACLSSVLDHTDYPDFEVVVVDTGSEDKEALEYLRRLDADDERVHLVFYHDRFNYSKACNMGAAQATGDVLVFLNNDVEILEPDWLDELAMWATRDGIGCVGAQLLYPDGRIQHAGVVAGLGITAGHIFAGLKPGMQELFGSTQWYRNYLAVTGACLALRRNLFDEVGGFEEAFEMAFSDVELCLKVRDRGYRNVYDPFVRLIHHERQSRKTYTASIDDRLGVKMLKPYLLEGDPYYHPALSTSFTQPTLMRKNEESAADRVRWFLKEGREALAEEDEPAETTRPR